MVWQGEDEQDGIPPGQFAKGLCVLLFPPGDQTQRSQAFPRKLEQAKPATTDRKTKPAVNPFLYPFTCGTTSAVRS